MVIQRYSTFLEMLASQKQDSISLLFEEGGEKKSLTYGELIERIRSFPVEPHGCVGIFADGTLASLLAVFAYASKGIQIALLSPLDDPRVLVRQIQAADVDFLLGPKPLVDGLQPALSKRSPITSGKMLFFTSGTTSSNKAVILSEKSLCAAAYNGSYSLPLSEHDTLYACLPLNHVFGFVCSYLWGFSCGAKVALCRGLKSFFSDFSYYRPTVASLVPQMASFLCVHRLYNPELGLILIGAGDCPSNVLNGLKSAGVRVSFGYGLTETSSGVALSLGDDPYAMSVCTDDRVLLSEDGEILLDCPTCLMEGYYRDEESTKAAIVDGLLHTGDLGKFDEKGLLHIIGRKKDVLVLGDGTKIFLPEYEGRLSSYLGPDKDFAVTLNKKGQVTLCFGKSKLGDNCANAVLSFNESCPRSQRIAETCYFPDPLPRTQTGKIKRWQLLDMLND